MREKTIVICMFLLSFLLGVAIIGTGKASPALTFGCDPDVTIGTAPGDPFDVYLTAFEVSYLFLAEFSLSWDPAILTTTVDDINLGDVAPYLDWIWMEQVNNDEGWLKVTVGRPSGVKEGLTGDVQCAKITFTVVAEGNCGLYPYNIRLKNVQGADLTIDRIIDGFIASSGYGHYAFACDSTGALQNVFGEGETVYVVGGGFSGRQAVDIYVVPSATWTDGDLIGTSVIPVVTIETVMKVPDPHLKNGFPPTALGVPPADYYDIIVDFDQNGVYDAATDAVDDVTDRPGFTGSGAPPVPEFPFGVSVIMLLAPIIPLAYLWRLRRKVIKQ